jgi:uncharacterized membrane protein YeaQ/YmgE (transglycosylase-associated protein family)
MDFSIVLGLGGWALVVVAAIIFGVVAQYLGDPQTGYEWLADAIAFGIGSIVASELIIATRTFGPVWDGLALVPALVGGLIVGVIVEVATRMVTGGTYTTHHRPVSA